MKAEVDHGFELRTCHVAWNVDREAEPRRTPWPAPLVAEGERPVVAGHCLVEGDGLARSIPRVDGERNGIVVQRWKDSLEQLAADAGLDELQVVVHDARLVTAAITLTA